VRVLLAPACVVEPLQDCQRRMVRGSRAGQVRTIRLNTHALLLLLLLPPPSKPLILLLLLLLLLPVVVVVVVQVVLLLLLLHRHSRTPCSMASASQGWLVTFGSSRTPRFRTWGAYVRAYSTAHLRATLM
jgi:hypothetical protein